MTEDLLDELRARFAYDAHTGHLTRRVKRGKWAAGTRVGTKDSKGHRQVRFNGKLLLEHRVIWFIVYGYIPEEIDHINRVRDDNRLANLRECTHRENNRNMSVRWDSSTRVPGVARYPRYGKFVAYITLNGKRRHLGYFAEFDAAVAARKAAEVELFKEFAADREAAA